MSVRFYDWFYVIDCKKDIAPNLIFVKDKLDERTLLQKRVDQYRFRKNKIEAYSEKLNNVMSKKLQMYDENSKSFKNVMQNTLWQLFGISSFPEDENDRLKTIYFLKLYEIIKDISIYKKKEINRDNFLKAIKVLNEINFFK